MAISDLKLPEGVNAHTFKNPAILAEELATKVAGQLNAAIGAQGVATLVVSGGRSPVAFFQSLIKAGYLRNASTRLKLILLPTIPNKRFS